MDLHTLKIFQTVAKLGSISRTARELQYAQSNITMKMQQLEADLQATLFYSHNCGTLRLHSIPNPYGKVKTIVVYRKDKYVPVSLIKFIDMLSDDAGVFYNKSLKG
ncbi:LysR family transcriptional regulator [Ectobacillus funiculus]|uniref:LysR family transcriptional regulator n=1 Tax=Ectobacillus funiculus TaxID=137993 RepID=UPI00397CD1CD